MPVTQTENHSQFINNGIESFLKKNIYEVLIFVAAALYQISLDRHATIPIIYELAIEKSWEFKGVY